MSKKFEIATILVASVDIACIIVSVAVKQWIYVKVDTVTTTIGLWEICTKSKDKKIPTCLDLDDSVTENKASMGDVRTVRAMLLLALLLVTGTLAYIRFKRSAKKQRQTHLDTAGDFLMAGNTAGAFLVAGFFLMVAVSVFVAKIYTPMKEHITEEATLGVGFAFCVISWLLSWLCAGLTFAAIFSSQADEDVEASQ